LGWHYLLDLSWIIARLADLDHQRVVDAGAGTGLLQWYMAGKGAMVTSVDRTSRAALPLSYRLVSSVRGLRSEDLQPAVKVWAGNVSAAKGPAPKLKSFVRGAAGLLALMLPVRRGGEVLIYNQDLLQLKDIPSQSQDAVVAVSALEHNSPENLQKVVVELMRVLKPGGVLLATLGAARDQDWFHEPSHGWCYTAQTLRRLFELSEDVPDNYADHDRLFADLRGCAELRDNLADFYFKSGDNGMPWGRWDPQYQSVGVCKLKG